MYSYELLEPGCYYLVMEKQNDPVKLIKVNLASDHCMFVSSYEETESYSWKKKTDTLFDIVELLDDKAVKEWESIYNNNEDAFYEEDDE